MRLLQRLLPWLFPSIPSTSLEKGRDEGRAEPVVARLHVPRSVMYTLRVATHPTREVPEPLVLLHARFASEQILDTVVAVAASAFPASAYVDGFAGANFDTAWVVDAANAAIARNVGLFLVHSHGGAGVPSFSGVDRKTNREVMAVLANGVTTAPYGAMVLSRTSATAVLARDGGLAEMRVVEVPDRLSRFEMTA